MRKIFVALCSMLIASVAYSQSTLEDFSCFDVNGNIIKATVQEDSSDLMPSGSENILPSGGLNVQLAGNTTKAYAIPYSLDVTPTGATTVNIPLECRTSRGGMKPSLSISYNSQLQEGLLGKGWSLSGLSTISYGPQSYYYDGKTKGVSQDNQVYYLDGQRLIYIESKDGNEYYQSVQGHVRAKLCKTDSIYFEVMHRDGSHAIYGRTDGISYYITHLTGKYGEQIDYSYEMISGTGLYRLEKITYDGGDAAIVFGYSKKTSQDISYKKYVGGKEYALKYWLSSVGMIYKKKSENYYSFNCNEETIGFNKSLRLAQVVNRPEEGSAETNTLDFSYNELDGATVGINSTSKKLTKNMPFESYAEIRVSRGRIDNATETDAIIQYENKIQYYWDNKKRKYVNKYGSGDEIDFHITNENGVNKCVTLTAEDGLTDVFFMDVDGDGNNEVLKINDVALDGKDMVSVAVYGYNAISGLSKKYIRKYDFGSLVNGSIAPKYYFVGDFDGNGKPDLMTVSASANTGTTKIGLIDVAGGCIKYVVNPFEYKVDFPSDTYSGADAYKNSDKLNLLDYDGDGKTDLCLVNDNGFNLLRFESQGDELAVKEVKHNISGMTKIALKSRYMVIGDFNGDGLSDIMRTAEKSQTSIASGWTLFASRGNGQFAESTVSVDRVLLNSTFFVQDINMDGYDDILRFAHADYATGQPIYVKVYIMGDKGAIAKIPFDDLPDNMAYAPAGFYERNNWRDFITLTPEGELKSLSYTMKQDAAGLMTSLKANNGIEYEMEYALMQPSSGNYEISTEKVEYPFAKLSGSVWLTKATKRKKSGTLVNNISYRYTDGVMNLQGLGFQGFRTVESRDAVMKKWCVSDYDPMRFGVLKRSESDAQTIENEYKILQHSNKLLDITLEHELIEDKSIGLTSEIGRKYDSYGNITNEHTYYRYWNVEKIVDAEYANRVTDTENYIGFPTKVTETSYYDEEQTYKITETAYNPQFDPTDKTISRDASHIVRQEKYAYDSNGAVLRKDYKDYGGDWLKLEYAYSDKRLVSQTDELGRTDRFEYDDKTGLLSSKTNSKGAVTSYGYNNRQELVDVYYPDGSEEHTARSGVDNHAAGDAVYKIERRETGKPVSIAYYNALDQKVRECVQRFDGDWLNTEMCYDFRGRLMAKSQPYKADLEDSDIYEYDDYDRLLLLSKTSGKTESYIYDGLTTTTTVNGMSSKKTYDVWGNLLEASDPGGKIEYDYNPDRNVTQVKVNGNRITTFEYDEYGRKLSIDDPSAGKTAYEYDNAGNMSKETDARGHVTTMAYDRYGRLTQKATDDGLTTAYAYDSDGNLVQEECSNGYVAKYAFDDLSRVNKESYTLDYSFFQRTYTYGVDGLVSGVSYYDKSADHTIANKTFKRSNGTLVKVSMDNGIGLWELLRENEKGQVAQVQTGPLVHDYDYGGDGHVVKRRVLSKGGVPVQDMDYKYSVATGNMAWRQDNMHGDGLRENFEYDGLNRLTAFGTGSVTYGADGNITKKTNTGTFSFTGPTPYAFNQIVENGSQIAHTKQEITYNAMGLPETIKENDMSATFVYNGSRQRIKMSIGQLRTPNHYNCNYLGDCYEDVDEMRGDMGFLSSRLYIDGDAYSSPAVLLNDGNGWKVHYIIRDNLGSITHITDAAGNVEEENSYDPWGNLRDPETHVAYLPNAAKQLMLKRGFTGHEHLLQFGLINMNARLYDPATGQFLSPDPMVQAPDLTQNFNRYAYCLNNPLKYNDPDGEFFIIDNLIAGAIGGIFNVSVNLLSGNIHSFGQGAALFGVGFVAGVVATCGVPMLSAAIIAAGNSVVNQGFTNGWNHISVPQVLGETTVAMVSQGATSALGQLEGTFAQSAINWVSEKVSVPALSKAITSAIVEVPTSFTISTSMSLLNGDNVKDALSNGGSSALTSLAISAVNGGVSGYYEAKANRAIIWDEKPLQNHHFATNKNKAFTPEMMEIVEKYDLKLDGDWNKAMLPHQGRHPNDYHMWVLMNMRTIDAMPNMNSQKFQQNFNKMVIKPVLRNPEMLYKNYWLTK